MTKEQIENILCHYLGALKVLWLPYGLAYDDDTNGHVDNIATFVKPAEIVLSWTDNTDDEENQKRCKAAYDYLCNEVDAKKRKLIIHKLHLPKPMHYTKEEVSTLDVAEPYEKEECKNLQEEGRDNLESIANRIVGERLAGSYVNYYLANEAIVLPQFGDDEFDERAIGTMKSIFPSKEVIGVYSREVLLGGGNIHCITQQLPYFLKTY